jgi:hypothetical protein
MLKSIVLDLPPVDLAKTIDSNFGGELGMTTEEFPTGA